ncbi:MAG: HPF/RaiA family ribosome-associated protein [Planctomycetota bacterium]
MDETPLTILSHGLELDEDLDAYVRSRIGSKLGKFETHMERISVRFSDLNGPKGGVDTECRVQVSLHSVPVVVVSARGTEPRRAFDSVANLVARTVQRSLERAGFSEGRAAKRAGKKTKDAAKATGSPVANGSEPEARATERHTGERNKRKKTSKAAVMLEDSANGKPSRKSTRKGANRLRSGQSLERQARDRVGEPQSRAAAAGVRRK